MEDLTVAEITAAFSVIWEATKDGQIEESEREKKEMEFREGIQKARLKRCDKPSYFVMTINMNGEGNAPDQRNLLSLVMRSFFASVIFCQELPGKFAKEVVENCGTGGYCFVPSEKEAAVMWAEEDFDGESVDIADKRTIRKRLVNGGKIDRELASEIPARTAVVKLKIKGEASNCTPAFLAVSWHGPFRGTNLESRKKVVKALFSFLYELCREKGVFSAIIGGDFNLNTVEELDDDEDLAEPNVSFPSYELSPRSERSRDRKGPGRRFISYKDNFAFFTIQRSNTKSAQLFGDITVSSVRSMLVFVNSEDPASDLLKKDHKDVKRLTTTEVLDHDPVIGVLHLETGKFRVQETRDLLALSIVCSI